MLRIAAPLLLAAGLALASCSTDTAPQTPAATVPPAPAPAARPAPTACPLPVYDLDTDQGTQLSVVQVRQMLVQNPQLPAVFKHYNQYDRLVVLDTLRCANYHLVPVLLHDESCCTTLCYLTTTVDGHSVVDSVNVAGEGADGQWSARSALKRRSNGELEVISWEEEETDVETEPNTLDSTITTFALTPQGQFIRRQLSKGGRNLRRGEHIWGKGE